MPVTALYGGALALLFIFLATRVIGFRRSAKVSIGDGGNSALLRRIRVHGNFAEYVPFAIVLMALAESMTAPAWLLHAAGLALAGGRVCHAYGVSQSPENFRLRITGMAVTFTVLGVMAATCIILSAWGILRS
jgi:hypothetical protein